MKNDASFNDAKRLYLEQYGDPMVTNTYLKIALALLSVVCVALALIDLMTLGGPRRSITTTLNTNPKMLKRSISSLSFVPFITSEIVTPSRTIFRKLSTSSTASSPTAFWTNTARTTSSESSSRIRPQPKSISR